MVNALGRRSRKLSNVLKGHQMGDQNLLSRAPLCIEGHVKSLVLAAFAVFSAHQSTLGHRGEFHV
jgi:hypothetical protein